MPSINWAGLGWLCVFVWALGGFLVSVWAILCYTYKPK
jgi:hypothetical protein